MSGRFGDGAGKWQLFVSADHPIRVMNLLSSASGHLANLSTSTAKPDLAPANQAAFDALVVGKRMVSPTISPDVYHFAFISPGRFREVEGSETWTGRYTYRKIGANAGGLETSYDDGDRCKPVFLFETPTTGVFASACDDGETDAGSWRLVDIPATGAPDLVVQPPSVSNSSPSAGQSFTLTATVRNQGGQRSAATTLRWYRSSDATISTSDTEVGTDPVSGLAASGTSSESISLTAPSSPGTYYYGACVDSVSGEPEIANNCSSAVRVTVGASAGLAPVDQAAFDARFVGKRYSERGEDAYADFVSPGRFIYVEEGETYPFSYTYKNTGLHTGTIEYRSEIDASYHCAARLTFRSATTGNISYSCSDGDTGTESWRLVDIPT